MPELRLAQCHEANEVKRARARRSGSRDSGKGGRGRRGSVAAIGCSWRGRDAPVTARGCLVRGRNGHGAWLPRAGRSVTVRSTCLVERHRRHSLRSLRGTPRGDCVRHREDDVLRFVLRKLAFGSIVLKRHNLDVAGDITFACVYSVERHGERVMMDAGGGRCSGPNETEARTSAFPILGGNSVEHLLASYYCTAWRLQLAMSRPRILPGDTNCVTIDCAAPPLAPAAGPVRDLSPAGVAINMSRAALCGLIHRGSETSCCWLKAESPKRANVRSQAMGTVSSSSTRPTRPLVTGTPRLAWSQEGIRKWWLCKSAVVEPTGRVRWGIAYAYGDATP